MVKRANSDASRGNSGPDDMTQTSTFKTPWGWVTVTASAKGLTAIDLSPSIHARKPTGAKDDPAGPLSKKRQANSWPIWPVRGREFSLPIDWSGGTTFQRKVWKRSPPFPMAAYGPINGSPFESAESSMRGPWGWPWARIRSPSSSPVIGSLRMMVRWAGFPAGCRWRRLLKLEGTLDQLLSQPTVLEYVLGPPGSARRQIGCDLRCITRRAHCHEGRDPTCHASFRRGRRTDRRPNWSRSPGVVGVAKGDEERDLLYLVEKLTPCAYFCRRPGKMNRSLVEVGGEVLLVSQFTLLGDTTKGRRPGFDRAAAPDEARTWYEQAVTRLRAGGVKVETVCSVLICRWNCSMTGR